VRSIVFSSDGQRIVTGSSDSTIRVWDAYRLWETAAESETDDATASLPRRLDELLNLSEHQGGVNAVHFTAAGRNLLSASADGSAILWYGSDVEPAIRLSDRATQYDGQAGSVVVDEHLIVMAPTGMKSPRGPYQATISIQSEATADGPDVPAAAAPLDEQLSLDDSGDAIELQATPDDPDKLLVRYKDPVRDQWTPVGTLQRLKNGRMLRIEVEPHTSGAALQHVLRHVRYTIAGASGELSRVIEFKLIAPGASPEEVPPANKQMNVTMEEQGPTTTPVAAVDVGLHHLKPAGLSYQEVVGESPITPPSP
jgi:hypothetical protein